jgi:hypothetical protein
MSLATLNNFTNLQDPQIRATWDVDYKRLSNFYSMYYDQMNSDMASETTVNVVGLGALTQKVEGAGTPQSNFIEGYTRTTTHVPYALKFGITHEMALVKNHNFVRQSEKALPIATNNALDLIAAAPFNNGFDSSYTLGDGVEWFSDVHPLKGGGTDSNELATAAVASESTIDELITGIRTCTDDRGVIINLRPTKIMYHPSQHKRMVKLFDSPHEPSSANNDINSLRGHGIKRIENPFLTDTDAAKATAKELD